MLARRAFAATLGADLWICGCSKLTPIPGWRQAGRLNRNRNPRSQAHAIRASKLLLRRITIGEAYRLIVEKGESSEGQQQRIRASRRRDEASSGVRIVFCFTMLFKIRSTTPGNRCQFCASSTKMRRRSFLSCMMCRREYVSPFLQ